jgi:hypothetical protein
MIVFFRVMLRGIGSETSCTIESETESGMYHGNIEIVQRLAFPAVTPWHTKMSRDPLRSGFTRMPSWRISDRVFALSKQHEAGSNAAYTSSSHGCQLIVEPSGCPIVSLNQPCARMSSLSSPEPIYAREPHNASGQNDNTKPKKQCCIMSIRPMSSVKTLHFRQACGRAMESNQSIEDRTR